MVEETPGGYSGKNRGLIEPEAEVALSGERVTTAELRKNTKDCFWKTTRCRPVMMKAG